MEMIDVLNSDGSSTGQQVSRKEVHTKGLWHRAIHVWFVNSKNEILLQKRADHIVSHPGEYDVSVAGHLSAGDTSIGATLREIEEELGVKLKENDLIKLGEVKQESIQHNGAYINKEYNDIYLVHKDIHVEDFIVQESEVSLVKYISIDEFKKWAEEKRKNLVMHPKEFEILFQYFDK